MTDTKQYTDSTYARQALLPEGLRDLLPTAAEAEAHTIHQLMAVFASFGYDRVSPPLAEFEDSLLIGPGNAKGDSMFRLMDPDSRKVMALRSDMTPQIARIAATRLRDVPRPLRLAYGGNVLRVKGSQIRPTRQFFQAGIELIGESGTAAQVEVIRLAVTALEQVGIKDLSIDLTVAPFVPAVCEELGLDSGTTSHVRAALDARDIGALAVLPDDSRTVFEGVLRSSGSATEAIAALKSLNLSGVAAGYVTEIEALTCRLGELLPQVDITVDAGESHGFDYKSGLGFALFSKSHHGELGRGGRYQTTFADGSHEPATGFSMYLDSLMQAVPKAKPVKKIYVVAQEDIKIADTYREQGWRVIQGLTDDDNSLTKAQEKAAKLGCSHIHSNGEIITL